MSKTSVQSLSPADHEGWMTKQGGSWKSWKKRWFVLKGNSLYYFKSKSDADVTGIIEITSGSYVRKDDNKKSKKYTLSVGTASRIFFMYPDSEGEMNQWIKSIQGVIDRQQGGGGSSVSAGAGAGAGAGSHFSDDKPVKPTPQKEDEPEKTNYGSAGPVALEGVRANLEKGKNAVSFLLLDDSKVLEFWQIWCESIPPQKDITEGSIVYEVYTAADMEKLSWRASGAQNIFIQRMVDFFWNVGAPETEIDRLNDVGALINPVIIGSWIDMSAKGGMDGGWFFRVDVPMKFALEACDPGDPVTKVADWAEENNITRCNYVGRDMGAAPPRQTEIRFVIPGDSREEQLSRAQSAYEAFSFPAIPDEALSVIQEGTATPMQLSVITSSEGFVRLGLMVPSPTMNMVERLCSMSGNTDQLVKFQSAIAVEGPTYAEFQYLMQGFGYGVYKEGFDIVFHYKVGEEVR